MTFQEQHYKEQEMFEKINRLRDAVYSNNAANADKARRRQDFSQQVKDYAEVVSFKATGKRINQPRGFLLQQGILNNTGTFGRGKKKDQPQQDTLIRDGGKSVVQERMTWTTSGYEAQTRPTAVEQKLDPPKLPSLRDKKNGRYPRQLQNKNSALSEGNGRQ